MMVLPKVRKPVFIQNTAMESFSQRQGLEPAKAIQFESMDEALRNSLWNLFLVKYLQPLTESSTLMSVLTGLQASNTLNGIAAQWARAIWLGHFKERLDEMPRTGASVASSIGKHFFTCKWHKVYDFLEFIVTRESNNEKKTEFIDYCNEILEEELSGYRLIGDLITPITSDVEISAIEEAILHRDRWQPVSGHLKRALELLSDRQAPDYRNSIKESISAVESACCLIAGDNNASLGKALNSLEAKGISLHTALKKSFSSLYGYTSNADGIRHAMLNEPNLEFEDAKFMLVSCSGFANYLIEKSRKAGIII